MKRSELEEKLESILKNLDSVKMGYKIKAKCILDELETLGMEPPETEEVLKIKHYDNYTTVKTFSNKWDKE